LSSGPTIVSGNYRNSQTGEADPNFQKTFVTQRRETLPEWVDRSRFNHCYRLAVNTRVPDSEAGKIICIGDELRMFDPLRFASPVATDTKAITAGRAIEVAEID
jgi:hypothetical protein